VISVALNLRNGACNGSLSDSSWHDH
jgi:hypothetical protein